MAALVTKRWWKYFNISIAVIASASIALACADYYYEPFSMFSPEISGAKRFQDFYFDDDLFYFPNNYYDNSPQLNEDNTNDFNQSNVKEWVAFFGNKVDSNDITQLLYATTNGQIDTLIFYSKDAAFPISASLRKNSINNFADKAAVRAFLFYLGFANRTYTHSPTPYYYWDEERKAPDKAAISELIKGGQNLVANVKYPFIAERYFFQITRLYFYGGMYSQCVEYYNSIKDKFKESNNIPYRAAAFAAGANYKLQNYAQSNYMYAMVFDKCPQLRQSSYISFHPQEEADWQQTLALAKNNNEKMALWFLLGMYADDVRACSEIYKIDPSSDYLAATVSRVVNIAENNYGNTVSDSYLDMMRAKELTSFTNSTPFAETTKPAIEAVNLLSTIAEAENTGRLAYNYIAAAYMHIMTGNTAKASTYLRKAQGNIADDDVLMMTQWRIVNLVNKIYSASAIDSKIEQEILPELNWLDNYPSNGDRRIRHNTAYSFVKQYLARRYYMQNETVKSQCFDYGLSPIELQDEGKAKVMLAFLQKKDKTPYEQYMQRIYRFKEADIYELWGTAALYAGDLPKALENLAKGNIGEFWANPFVARIRDCHDCDIEAYRETNHKMDRYTFVQKLMALEKEATENPKKTAQNYFDIATGYYNITYYGNNRIVSETAMGETMYYWENPDQQVSGYFSMRLAHKYYLKALQASKDKEFAAKCTYMAAKCELNAHYTGEQLEGTETNAKEYKMEGEWYETTFIAGTYFKMLKNDFPRTQYYKEILRECGYFKLYAR